MDFNTCRERCVKMKKYRIGEFAELVDIPARTLRFYATNGILVPSIIDKYTGYRYYTEDDIIHCKMIKLLKSLDFTLDEILEYKDSFDGNILEEKKKELEERMDLLKTKYNRINVIQKAIKEGRKINTDERFIESYEEKEIRRKYERKNIKKHYE